MDFEVYWENEYVGKFVNGVCVEQVYHNTKLDVVMTYPAELFLERRVFPKVRWDDEMRSFYGLEDWSPLEICKITNGLMVADFLWIKFPDDDPNMTWEDVKAQYPDHR